MQVLFRTNLDWYQTVAWPILENIVPRTGEFIRVHPGSESFCHSNKIPIELEVVNVTYTIGGVICELWYKANLLSLETKERRNHLMKQ